MMRQNLTKHIYFTVSILVVIIILFGVTEIDTFIQDYFFNFEIQQWILDRELQPYKFLFYDGLKKLLIFSIVLLLFLSVIFRKTQLVENYKKGIMVVVLSSILVPVIVGGLKKSTNMPCPKNEIHYGGDYPKTAVWEHYPKELTNKPKIRCWPAGHASGGFALLSLFFLFKTKKIKTLAVVGAVVIGWSMGIYKMLIGDHFLSHTLITMLLSWFIILTIVTILNNFWKVKR